MIQDEKFVRNFHPDLKLIPCGKTRTNVFYDGNFQGSFCTKNKRHYFKCWKLDILGAMLKKLEKSNDK